ncbi:MAG: sugar ABC transporter substrate-binding protein, partial [SAR324 cluster bacterium]|nr:sugar ABC transporter substrate-binding protein [SAR324 cluster bacterium]
MKSKKKINRRQFVKDASTVAAGASVIAAGSGAGLGLFPKSASAANVRRDILRIPGVGKGSPTDSDWQKVGALCLNPTKARVSKGEFDGVELTFMGLNNQNLHN